MRGKTFFDCKDNDARRDLLERALLLKKDRKPELQKSLGLEVNPDACLYTMLHRLCEQKGYEAAIPAMREMLKSHPDIQIVVGGPADDFGQGKLFKDELDEIAIPIPAVPRVLMPMNSPQTVVIGPPLIPGLIVESVCINSTP